MISAAERVTVGQTSLQVSRLGLGTVPLGNLYSEVTDTAAAATLSAAWDQGLRWFDTAPVYGYGLAERRLGAALAGREEDEYVLSTKVGRLLRGDASPDPALSPGGVPFFVETPALNPVFDFSAEGVRRSLEESLERLGVARCDVVFIHDPDDHFEEAVTDAYPALHALREEGIVGAIGVGMTQSAMLARFVAETDIDCVMLAGRFTLLDQDALDELFPRCVSRGISVLLGGVLNSGILAGLGPATYDYVPAPPDVVLRARRIAEVCARHGVPLAAAALQFPFRNSAVTAAVVGMRNASEVMTNVMLLGREIPDDLWQELEHLNLVRANDRTGPAEPPSENS
ncbi:MAG: aldo/keto reductase [Candidatus Dormibacteraeota bacterium]|nr:aldo/keto reductase [Candidatus Dormibacteraeota bacterium]